MHPQKPSEYANQSNAIQGETIGVVVRDVIAEHEPRELPIVDGLLTLEHRQAVRLMKRRPRKHEQLGFGAGEIMVLLAPILWLALDEAVRLFVEESIKAAGGRLSRRERRAMRKPQGQVQLPPMGPAELDLLWEKTKSSAIKKRLSEEEAESLADALISRIVRDQTGGPSALEPPESEPPSIEPKR